MQAYLDKALKEITDNLDAVRPLMGGDFTDEDLSVLYSLAQGLYGHGDYVKAREIFQQLVLAKPFEPKHWFGLASVLQMEKEYQRALTGWSMAAMMLDEPTPHFHAAECLASLGNFEQADRALDEAEKRLGDHAELKNQISTLRESFLGSSTR